MTGTPKADFTFCDSNDKEIFYVSHKKGGGPEFFNQWSGITKYPINDHDEVKTFVSEIKETFVDKIPEKTTAIKKINCDTLKKISVYGDDYGSNTYTVNNVNYVMSGDIKLVSNGNHYDVVSEKILSNGSDIKDKYEPVLAVVYKNDRNQYGIKSARFSIQPISSRKANLVL